jgi:hypothetical protein
VHLHLPKTKTAKLPMSAWETARIDRYRGILDNLIVKGNELALAVQAEILRETADRQAARAAAAQSAAASLPAHHAARRTKARAPAGRPAPTQDQDQAQAQAQSQAAEPAPEAATQRRPAQTRLEHFYLQLVRTIHECMRLDAWFAAKLAGAHTTADLAGLNNPNRQPILDYLHKVTRFIEPYQVQRSTHNDLETRVSEELAWQPDRNPGDIIAEICTHYHIAHNPEDYPNGWRPTGDHLPPRPTNGADDDTEDDIPIALTPIRKPEAGNDPQSLLNTVWAEMDARGLL